MLIPWAGYLSQTSHKRPHYQLNWFSWWNISKIHRCHPHRWSCGPVVTPYWKECQDTSMRVGQTTTATKPWSRTGPGELNFLNMMGAFCGEVMLSYLHLAEVLSSKNFMVVTLVSRAWKPWHGCLCGGQTLKQTLSPLYSTVMSVSYVAPLPLLLPYISGNGPAILGPISISTLLGLHVPPVSGCPFQVDEGILDVISYF